MQIKQVARPKLKGGRHRPSVEMHVFLTEQEVEQLGLDLVTSKEAARASNRAVSMIGYWVRRGYVKKYYVFGNEYNYQVDLDEVLEQEQLGRGRIRNPHDKSYYLPSNRHKDGKFK